MRRWQQDLALSTEGLDIEPGPEATGTVETSEKATEEVMKCTDYTFTDYHIAAAVFVVTLLVLICLKPVLILHRCKDRPEESPRISIPSVLLLCTLSSAIYLGLVFRLFS